MNRCAAPTCTLPGAPFCDVHAKASPGQRGGWLSAAKRQPYGANAVAPRLWVGPKPPFDRDLPGIDVLVLCAVELQPANPAFHGKVVHCPLPDANLDITQAALATTTSVGVAQAVAQGHRVLVTCAAGLNRSALIAALALAQLTTMSGAELIAHLRKHRGPLALSNQHFQTIVRGLVGDGRPRAQRRARTEDA